MTKLRKPGTFEDASVALREHFREEGCAGIIGMSESRVKQACDSERSNYTPYTLIQALELDVAYFRSTGKPGPLITVYRQRYAERTGQGEAGPSMSPVQRVGAVSSETNDVVQAIIGAIRPDSDGGVEETPRECLITVREIDEAIAELGRQRSHYAARAGISADIRPAGVVAMLNQREAS